MLFVAEGSISWNPNKTWHPYFESMEMFLARIDRRWSYVLGTVAHAGFDCVRRQRCDLQKYRDAPRNTGFLKSVNEHFYQTLNELPENTILLLNGALPITRVKSLGKILSPNTISACKR